jgi:hypothetical protein
VAEMRLEYCNLDEGASGASGASDILGCCSERVYVNGSDWCCTRALGHKGPHHAHGTQECLCVWSVKRTILRSERPLKKKGG